MSSPILAFDINAKRGESPASDGSAKQDRAELTLPVQAETAKAEAVAPARLKARAELATIYAKYIGADISARDLSEFLTSQGGTGSLHEVANALNAAGLISKAKSIKSPLQSDWPALAEMSSGHLILVLEQKDKHFVIFDADQPDNRDEVPSTDFLPYFTGNILRVDRSVQDLTEIHAGTGPKSHWFWGEVLKFRRYLFEIALGSFVANLLAVAVALFSLQVYDRVIPHQSTATLWVLAIGAGVALIFEAFLRIARARLMDAAGRSIELRVQSILMQRLLGMRRGLQGQTPSGLFSAVREFSSVREFFTASSVGVLTDLPFIFLFLALVASIGGPVVWVLIIGGLLMVLPSFILQRKMVALTHQTQGASVRANKLLHEVIYEADTIKSQRGEDRFRRLWNELSAVSSLSTSEQRKLSAGLTFWAQGVQQATYVSAVVVGTFLVFQGEFTVGTIIAIGILTGRTLGPLTQLAGTLTRWSNVKGALQALDGVALAEQDEADDRQYLRRDTVSGAYELHQLSYCYDEDSAQSVDIAGLKIEAGQRIAVLGANGSGKSTLLRLLAGLYQPTQGRILIDGIDMGQVMPRDLRRSIGYLGQEIRLFSGTLRDNLNMSMLENDDDRLLAALDFAGLGQFVRNHPKGLDLVIHDGGEGLSIGQRQSIGWARLWLQDPKVCLLDEPTAALDQTLEATLVSRLAKWLEGRTAVIATHRVPIIHLTERTIILQNGRLAVDGPRDDVLNHLRNKSAGA